LYRFRRSSRDFFSFKTFCAFLWSSQNPALRLSSSSSCIFLARPAGSKITSHFREFIFHLRKLASYLVKLQH
jgi:hypothetical protein